MESLHPLVLVVFVAVAAGGMVYGYVRKQRRREDLAYLALQLGLEYAPVDPFDLLATEPFALFSKGDGRGIENVLWGSHRGVDVKAFDYWYYEQSTDSEGHTTRSYRRFNCAIVPIDAACSPVAIANENVVTRLADHLAMRDIEFESEEFNRAFNVTSPDPRFANDLLDARMMTWLLHHGRGLSFEVVGDRVLCFRHRLPAFEVATLLGAATAFLERVPRVVFSLYPKAAAG